MRFALLLLIAPTVFEATKLLEKSHQKALLTFDEWDLNKDCFVTYEEFVNYFLDMMFSIRMFEALAVTGNATRGGYLSEEAFELAELAITKDISLLNNKADHRVVMKHLLFGLRSKLKAMPISTVSNVFKIRSVLNTTFWHRP